MAARASAPRASVDLSGLLLGASDAAHHAPASPAALRAYVAARARAAAVAAASEATEEAARAAELDAWVSRVGADGPLSRLLYDAAQAQAASPVAAAPRVNAEVRCSPRGSFRARSALIRAKNAID